jgi:hypothetical protein
MNHQQWTGLSDEELLREVKKMKSYKLYDSLIIGFLIGISIYSIIKNGFGLLTFLPLIYMPVAARNNKKRTALNGQLEERGLDLN